MKYTRKLIVVAFLLITPSISAGQQVGRLIIDYSPAFRKDTEATNDVLSNASDNVRHSLVSLETLLAKPTNGLGEVRLMKIRYTPKITANLQGAAIGASQRVATLDGVINFQQHIEQLTVSGLEARQVSISADRWGGKLGAEILMILDRKTNIMWQIQLIFSKSKGINPFASLNVDVERSYAKDLLSTIKVLK